MSGQVRHLVVKFCADKSFYTVRLFSMPHDESQSAACWSLMIQYFTVFFLQKLFILLFRFFLCWLKICNDFFLQFRNFLLRKWKKSRSKSKPNRKWISKSKRHFSNRVDVNSGWSACRFESDDCICIGRNMSIVTAELLLAGAMHLLSNSFIYFAFVHTAELM